MRGFVGRWFVRQQDQTRRNLVIARIFCEALEGRRLLSGGFGGGGMGGMGFDGGMGSGGGGIRIGVGSVPAEMGGLSGGGGSRAEIVQVNRAGGGLNAAPTGYAGTMSLAYGYSSTFANGRSGNATPFRPYMGWENSQTTDGNTIATTSTDAIEDTGPTTMPANVPTGMSWPVSMNGDFLRGASGNIGFMGGGPGYGGGGPGFAMSGNRGVGDGFMKISSPFDLGTDSNSTASAVQTAFDALRTELRNALPSDAKPTHASLGILMDDLEAIQDGTLTGTDATTKVRADEAAALGALGVTSDQIAAIQAREVVLVSAINSANSSDSTADTDSTPANSSRDPMKAMIEVPLLPFLSQLRQGRAFGSNGSSSTVSDSDSTASVESA